MADAAVEFLLGNLTQLLLYHAELIKEAKVHVENLEKDLRIFTALLKDSTKKRRKDESFRVLVGQIRDVVYEAEDIVDAFVTQASITKSKKSIRGFFRKPVYLHEIASKVQTISKQVEAYKANTILEIAALNIHDDGPEEPEAPVVKQNNIVGFEDVAGTITTYLRETTTQLEAITITGMPGQGKTTLAGKIYHDKEIQYEFPIRIWVYVSQDFTRKKVFLAILEELKTEDMSQKSEQDLAKKVKDELGKGKFLLVMDDVWAPEDWDKIKIALPESNSAGKVLITSRSEEVARCASMVRYQHKLRFMTQDESWKLFQYEVFRKPECPSELKVPGKIIVQHCRGLPLAIVVIAGILVKKFSASNDISLMRKSWDKVSESVNKYLTQEGKRMEDIIALSYNKLPYHLRACFLYLGMFPEDFEIPVWKLIRMWIAEGFIQKKDHASLEETAESFLDELINRNLVRADKRRPDGRVKTCRIHDMLREFCINEARSEKENFLQEIKGTFDGSTMKKYRRICVHSNVSNFMSSPTLGAPSQTHVRSFVCFSTEDHALAAEKASAIPAAFKLLRVLDVHPLKFEKVPSDMYQLLHLRYIVLSFNLNVLPASFSKLWNLETLIADTSSRTLEIKADIWKLRQLRHLKTNASASLLLKKETIFNKAGQNSQEGENLQTLGTISPESCTEEVFKRCRSNLKKLGIRGRLESFLDKDNKAASFEILGKLINLEKLKLLNDVFPKAASEDPMTRLPPPYQFPPRLKSLTLSDTFLDWHIDMPILGLLQNLEVLKLKDKAFNGERWEAVDGGFRRLEFLHIGRTDLHFWMASQHHFPRLRCLELHNCEKLQEIPIALAEIPTFGILDLQRSKEAAVSAIKIHDKKQKKGDDFKLTIFPPPPR